VDFNKARTFVQVVDSGGMTHAAKRLLRTQQAISLQLQQLETQLEINLFDRNGPKLTLTADGKKLYDDFKVHFTQMENALMALQSSKENAQGIIKIGVWMEQATYYLPQMIALFKQNYSRVEFEIIIADDAELERLLACNEIDLGLQLYCSDQKLFKLVTVYQQALIPVISGDFLTRNSTPETIADTLTMPLLDYKGQYSAYYQWMKKNAPELLPQAQKKLPSITASNNLLLKQLVLQGLGFSFLHREAIQAELESGELVVLLKDHQLQNLSVEIELVFKRKHTLGFVQQQFVQLLKDQRSAWM